MAYSGGRDSTALLHATLTAACDLGVTVHALHVHHGLHVAADAWCAHAQAQCRRWAARGLPVQFHPIRLQLMPARGDSVEAVARVARYRALGEQARRLGVTLVLLAHHRRDQAETLLLQALRGGGVAGLAGMPSRVERDGLVWARPWLRQPREAVEAYLSRHRLRYVDDDSNADRRFARNRLRLEVWPALRAAFPQAETTLADAARWAQQAKASSDDLAAIDLAGCRDGDLLNLAAWQRLAPHRAVAVLRAWLRQVGAGPIGAAEIERLQAELPGAGTARWQLGGEGGHDGEGRGELRRYRGRLHWAPAGSAHVVVTAPERSIALLRPGRYPLPGWGGVLVARRVKQGGVALSRLATLTLRARSGGEQFQAGAARPPRSLKKQFQALALPAWARGGPLLWSGDLLVFVPGLGVDARALASPGEPQLGLSWEPAG